VLKKELTEKNCDILIAGTGYFSEVMACDLATTAKTPLRVVIAGRNVSRRQWLATACNARAAIAGSPITFGSVALDSTSVDSAAETIANLNPTVFVQSASIQSPWSVDNGSSEWSELVSRAGFGITIAFHALMAWRAARAIQQLGLKTHFVNTCYPDGVNSLLRAAGVPITTGVGNIGIFSSIIAARLPSVLRQDLRVLAHHRHIVEWRKPVGTRAGAPVRAWSGEQEIVDVESHTRDIQLPYRDLNIISGGSAVPVLLALAGEGARRAHVPGPIGYPGGYPVQVSANGVALDLPKSLALEQAIAWNRQFEDADGVGIHEGRVVYSARARQELARYSAELAEGFAATDIEAASLAMQELRSRLGA
jgi:hypothetical protein